MIAALNGHAPVVTLLLADKRMDPNMTTKKGNTALMVAAQKGHAPVVTLLLANERVNPDMVDSEGNTLLMNATSRRRPRLGRRVSSVLELLLANHRIARVRPPVAQGDRRDRFDAALYNVKHRRRLRFKGLVRALVAFRRLRLRAAQAAYAPGAPGFAAAAASFEAGKAPLKETRP